MPQDAEAWPYQVVIRLTLADFREKLQDIEEWLAMWEIPYRIGATVEAAGAVRICFAEEKFARAFIFNKGGVMVPGDEIETAMLEDEADEAEYQRLAERMTKKDRWLLTEVERGCLTPGNIRAEALISSATPPTYRARPNSRENPVVADDCQRYRIWGQTTLPIEEWFADVISGHSDLTGALGTSSQ